jgi:hypothetical protein
MALELKLQGQPVQWSKLAKLCNVHPEMLRGRVRRRLNRKKDYLTRKKSTPVKYNTPKPYKGNPDNVLVIADLHAPFIKEGYLEFCRKVQEKYNCGTVIQIGDIIDGHAWNYHEHDPDGMSVGDELEKAVHQLKKFWQMFPEGVCTLGNHDQLIMRKAFSAGLSKRFMKEFGEILEAPKGWKFVHEYVHNNIMYVHGTGSSGANGAFNRARDSRMNTVMGHLHSQSYVRYTQSYKDTLWAMQVGWGGDNKQYVFEYGKTFPNKPILNCGVVIGDTPHIIPMK